MKTEKDMCNLWLHAERIRKRILVLIDTIVAIDKFSEAKDTISAEVLNIAVSESVIGEDWNRTMNEMSEEISKVRALKILLTNGIDLDKVKKDHNKEIAKLIKEYACIKKEYACIKKELMQVVEGNKEGDKG